MRANSKRFAMTMMLSVSLGAAITIAEVAESEDALPTELSDITPQSAAQVATFSEVYGVSKERIESMRDDLNMSAGHIAVALGLAQQLAEIDHTGVEDAVQQILKARDDGAGFAEIARSLGLEYGDPSSGAANPSWKASTESTESEETERTEQTEGGQGGS